MTDTTKRRVLVVDDEHDVITYLTALLRDAGYEVEEARNGQEALDAVRRNAPDLVSLDITMPEKSGVRFYREMREDEALKSVPIVIVTGVTNPWMGEGGEGSFEKFISSRRKLEPPEGFFEKPIEPQKYLARIAELLA